jgi:predicted phosphoribosyltransferase
MQSIIFRDRIEAANKLAERLKLQLNGKVDNRISPSSIVVLSIPRGGVVVGDVVATKLNAKLDLVVSRKIGAPFNPEFAIGAVMPDGSHFLNEDIKGMINIPPNYIEDQIKVQKKEIERRLMNFRGRKEYDMELRGKTVVLVDDGIATGATMVSAARWLKTKQNSQVLIIAVPVAPPDTVNKLKETLGNDDKVIVLYSPELFRAVGQFYKGFEQVSDTEVKEIMKRHGYKVDSEQENAESHMYAT